MNLSTSVLYIAADRETAAPFLEVVTAEFPSLSVDVTTSVESARDRLDRDDVDCIVAEDDAGGVAGVDFLAGVTEVPAVLYTAADTADAVRTARDTGTDVVFRSESGGPYRLGARIRSLVAATPAVPTPAPDGGSVEPARQSVVEAMVEAVDDGLYALDADGRFLAVNEAYERLTGYDREELVGAHATTVTNDAVHTEAEEVQAALERGEEVPTFRTELTRPDGTTIQVEAHLSLLPLGDGECGRVGVVRDVTEREHLKSELDQFNDRVTDVLVSVDTDWRYTYINEQAEQYLQGSREDHLGEVMWDVYEEAVGTPIETKLREAMETQEPVSFQTQSSVGDEWFRISAYPSETGLSIYFQDITERRQRGHELEQYRTIVETVQDGIYTVDRDGTFTFVNDAYASLVGYEREELLGEHVSLVTDDETIKVARAAGDELRAGNVETATVETRLTAADGERVPVEGTFALLPSEASGERVGVVRDVTERIRREEELSARIRQQTVTAELGQLVLEGDDIDTLFDEAVEVVAETLGADYCKVLDLQPSGEELLLRSGVGWREGLVGEATVGSTERASQAGHTLQSEEPIVVDDFENDPRIDGPELLTSHDVQSGISVLIGPMSDPWGILGVHDMERREFSDHDVSFVQSVANVLATAIDRMRRQHELRQYESMFETVKDGVYVLDSDGRFVSVNEAYADITGYEREELLGAHATTVSEVVYELATERQASLDAGEDGTIRSAMETADGRTVELEFRFAPFTFEDGSEGSVGVVRDITERERLRSELDEVLHRVTDGFFGLDTDWQFTFVNERAEELIANPSEELVGKSLWEKYPETVGTAFETEYRRAMETQQPVSFEEYFPPLETWFSVHAYPSETGLSVYFRDVTERKQREAQLSALNRTMQTLLDTTTPEEVVDIGVEAARDVLALSTSIILRYDEPSGRLYFGEQTADEAVAIDDALVDGDDAIAWQVFVENEPRVYDSLSAELGRETTVESVVLVPMGRHGVLLAADAEPAAFSENDLSLIDILSASVQSALDRADREATLRDRRDTLEEQNESLDRLRRVNGVIREITGTLTQASTREEIEEAVCDRLAATDPYRLAWIGSRDVVSGELSPRVSAGDEQGFVSTLNAADSEADGSRPAALAVDTLEPVVQNTIHGTPPFEPWREAALKRGFRSCIAVPIVHRDTLYGVLCLYASEPNVFNRMEQTVLGELGEIIGHALNALERKQALISERSVELDFEVADPLDQPLRLVADLGATFEYQNVVQRSDGHLHLFFVVRGASAEAVLDAGSTALDVSDLTLVADRDEELLFECTVAEETLFANLLERGALPQTVSMEGSTGRVVVRCPQNVEPRSMIELLERRFEQAELAARREHDDPVWTRQELHSAFENNLTDRQEEVLRTAHFAGFFEWPRESTGEEVADILDVSQPTVHRHVRAGERKLFSLLFDE
ncbi:PAS domain S-box protein [Halogranum amylolyticum]|nr:PAS domain S-box protein [Halogranum amylolyticum]